jgi:PAS domain S-box-containing protein
LPTTDRPVTAFKDDEEIYRALVETVRDYAIFLLTPEGIVATWNKGAEQIKGYKAQEIIGQHISRFYPSDMVERQWPQMELRVASEEGRFEDEGWRVRKDGSRFWANVIITALRDPDGKLRGYTKITRDLTERMRHEESLKVSEERLQLLVNNVADHAIFMLDPKGLVASWNNGAQRLKGYAAHEIIGRHFSHFYPQEAIERLWPEHELQTALVQGRFEDAGWRIRKDGSRFWANVVITPVYDAQHELRGFAKVTRDLTDRSRLIAMQSSEKHMNEFIAMLGHELRNPLGAISNAAALMKKLSNDQRLEKASSVLERQLGQLTRLVDDLLDVARIRQGKFTLRTDAIELWQIVEQAVEAVPLIVQKSHQLTMTPASEPLIVDGDRERLIQALVNVLTNAAKYMDEHGSITMVGKRSANEAVICIKDTGRGIDPELLPNVFDLFRQGERTLHDAQGGLGIGLTLVQRILQLHGGSVEARSHGHNQGSEFIIRLPIKEATA